MRARCAPCPLHSPRVYSGVTPCPGPRLFLLCKGNFLGRGKRPGVHSWSNTGAPSASPTLPERGQTSAGNKSRVGNLEDELPKVRAELEHIPGAALLPGDSSCCSSWLVFHNSAEFAGCFLVSPFLWPGFAGLKCCSACGGFYTCSIHCRGLLPSQSMSCTPAPSFGSAPPRNASRRILS